MPPKKQNSSCMENLCQKWDFVTFFEINYSCLISYKV